MLKRCSRAAGVGAMFQALRVPLFGMGSRLRGNDGYFAELHLKPSPLRRQGPNSRA